jgi:hypothetical protein
MADHDDQVGDLVFGVAVPALRTDVVLAGVLLPMFDLTDLGELPTRQVGERSAGEPRILAEITQASAESFSGLLGLIGHRRSSDRLIFAVGDGDGSKLVTDSDTIGNDGAISDDLVALHAAVVTEVPDYDQSIIKKPPVISVRRKDDSAG